MSRPNISVKVRRPRRIMNRYYEAITSTPARNINEWETNGVYIDTKASVVMLEPQWLPENYQWGKDYYSYYPPDDTMWIEHRNSLGRGDIGIGFTANAETPPTTPWDVRTIQSLKAQQPVVVSFLWNRPENVNFAHLNIYPRIDLSKPAEIPGYSVPVYFCPLIFSFGNHKTLDIYEYPYDSYEPFYQNPQAMLTQVLSWPLIANSTDLAGEWISLMIIPTGYSDVLVLSDVLMEGGFLYRSDLHRVNVNMFPEGPVAICSHVGGICLLEVCPLSFPKRGTLKSPRLSKTFADDTYPELRVFGWSPTVINEDNGHLTNQVIDPDTGFGGISYKIYALEIDPSTGMEMEVEVPTDGSMVFKDFKYEITLESYEGRSPVITDIILDYPGSLTEQEEEEIDISDDVISITESMGIDSSDYRATLRIRNQDGKYNEIAERPINEIDIDIDEKHKAILYTANIGYEGYATPTEPALFLEWECGDGFEYLKRELVCSHPPYDGRKLSDAIKEFMSRIGFPEDMLDIEDTPGVYLPKKRGREDFQFKPEDGTPAIDFINKLHQWFLGSYVCRFDEEGKFVLKDADNIEIRRTYFLSHEEWKEVKESGIELPGIDECYVVMEPLKIEILHDLFINELWVVGEDKRKSLPIIARRVNSRSQTDPTAPDYVGRRLIKIVLTKANTQDAVDWIANTIWAARCVLTVRVSFSSRLDPLLRPGDFIKIYGIAHKFKVQQLDNNIEPQNVTSSGINIETDGEGGQKPYIIGQQITAVSWPTQV